MSSILRLDGALLPITAIAHAASLVLTGEGPNLGTYKFGTDGAVSRHRIFKSQQIHGIAVTPVTSQSSWLAIWGGNLVRLGRISVGNRGEEPIVDLYPVTKIEDWILDAAFPSASAEQTSLADDLLEVVVVTAHNAVYALSTPLSGGLLGSQPVRARQLSTRSRSISYCARIAWTDPTRPLILLGTAFGEVFILSCSISGSSDTRVHAAFIAHEGSIFGLDVSLPVSLKTDAPLTRLMATCSDDRSVRVWDLDSILASEMADDNQLENAGQEHGTGFKTYHTIDEAPIASKSRYLASAMGHLSRIWKPHFVRTASAGSTESRVPLIVSIGEDCVCIMRELGISAGFDESMFSLTSIGSDRSHSGRNIWSSAQATVDGRSYMITGGADGGLVSRMVSPAGLSTLQIGFCSTSQAHDNVRSYALLGADTIISCTDSGTIFSMARDIMANSPESWTQTMRTSQSDLRGYNIAAGFGDTGFVLLGGPRGHIYIVQGSPPTASLLFQGEAKVSDMFDGRLSSDDRECRVIITYLQDELPDILVLRRDPRTTGRWTLRETAYTVNDDFNVSHCTITSAIYEDIHLPTVIFGTRDGVIVSAQARPNHLSTTADEADAVPSSRHVGLCMHNAHGKNAVTSMIRIAEPDDKGDGLLYSVGRDGCLRVVRLHFDRTGDNGGTFELLHNLSLAFGPNIESIHQYPASGTFYATGFSGTRFVLYDLLEHREVMSVECGGAHRAWKFQPILNDAMQIVGGTLLWTQAGKTCIREVKQPDTIALKQGSHGREIKTADVFSDGESRRSIIATGAEDTDVRLLRYVSDYANDRNAFRCSTVIRKHQTGLNQVQWSGDGKRLYTSGGLGELFVWRVSKVPLLGLGVVCEGQLPVSTDTAELRITCFDVLDIEPAVTIIIAGYSDSSMQFWRCDRPAIGLVTGSTNSIWTLIDTTSYTTACLTQMHVHSFAAEVESPSRLLVTASSDGHIALWDIDSTIECCKRSEAILKGETKLSAPSKVQRIHQSAIKCMLIQPLSPSTSIIITGGDDNAIGLTLLHRKHSELSCDVLLIPNAHAAAITACTLISCDATSQEETQFRLEFFTSSNDQRVKAWDCDVDLSRSGVEGVQIARSRRFGKSFGTAVADVSGLHALPCSQGRDGGAVQLFVTGVGMEMWRANWSEGPVV